MYISNFTNFVFILIFVILVLAFSFSFYYSIENYIPYGLNTRDEPEYVDFTNHNLTTKPRICNTPDPNNELYNHKPFDWKVKSKDDKVLHPLSPFKIEPSKTDSVMGYDTLCLRDYNCMIKYINPESDLRF